MHIHSLFFYRNYDVGLVSVHARIYLILFIHEYSSPVHPILRMKLTDKQKCNPLFCNVLLSVYTSPKKHVFRSRQTQH